MKTLTTLTLAAAVAWLAIGITPVQADDECCPEDAATTQPAQESAADLLGGAETKLPEGHPELPKGHPELPKGHPELPAGHPPMPGKSAGGSKLPSGHPSIAEMSKMGKMQTVDGTIVIKGEQGTEGGDKLAGAEASLELKIGNTVLYRTTTKLDEHGVAMIENMKVSGSMVPTVTIKHKGVNYSAIGSAMTPATPDSIVRVKVYEVTADKPAWSVETRHVMVKFVKEGVHVTELLQVNNPGTKTWRPELEEGAKDAVKEGEEAPTSGRTITLDLPAKATSVQLGGAFQPCCTKLVDHQIVSREPLPPGLTEFRFAYLLPHSNGAIELPVVNPATVKHLMMFVPETQLSTDVEGLGGGDLMPMGKIKLNVYHGSNLSTDHKIKLTVNPGTSAAADVARPMPDQPDAAALAPTSPMGAKAVAGIGSGVLIVGALAYMLSPSKGKAAAKKA